MDLVPPSCEKNLTSSISDASEKIVASLGRTEYQTLLYLNVAIEGIEALLIKGQLQWAGHPTRMEENRIPKAPFYGELVGGQRLRGSQHKRYTDIMKYNLKACDIPFETWERQALNHPEWRTACHVDVESFERRRIELLQETRIARHAA